MVVWLIGMSGAGKTVIGKELYGKLKEQVSNVVFLDGDIFRNIVGDDLGHSIEERKINADRFCRMCKFLDDQDIHVIAAILSIFPESREWNRKNLKKYFEVFIDVPFDELLRRDTKDLYKRALTGEIENVVGVDIQFVPPDNPHLLIRHEDDRSVKDIANEILKRALPQIH